MNKQRKVYEAIVARNYGPEAQGLTPEQFAARQVAKLAEENCELAGEVVIGEPGADLLYLATLEHHVFMSPDDDVGIVSKKLFDNVEVWQGFDIIPDRQKFIEEMTDCLIPLLCAAEALGVDLLDEAVKKATADIKRGVRE